MDLLATVRKEGSRGGSGNFQWSDVQTSTRRETYLGHSLMAPVGRWAKSRDPNWYSKQDATASDDEDPAIKAARERKEEIRRIKEAEQDALAQALGLPVAPRSGANSETVSNKREFDKVLLENTRDIKEEDGERGLGFSKGTTQPDSVPTEKLEGNAEGQDKELQYALKEFKRRNTERKNSQSSNSHNRHHHSRHDHRRKRSRSRSRSRDRDRNTERHRHRHRSHDRSQRSSEGRSRRRPRSKSPVSRHDKSRHHRSTRSRSRSPR